MKDRKPGVTKPRALRKQVEPDIGFNWGPVNTALLGLGLLSLVAGYVALSKGSTTLAPVLLVTGYCVLIPASLLVRRQGTAAGE